MRVKQTLFVVAGGVVFAGLALLVQQVREVPSRDKRAGAGTAEVNPLTDVAGRQPHRAVPRLEKPAGEGEPPEHVVDEEGRLVAPPPKYVLPADLPDPANPPQGTEPLALPGEPQPPDPFTAPEIEQDPHRGGRTH